MSAYRTAAEMPKERTPMNENEKEVAMGRIVARSIAGVLISALATIVAVNVYGDWTKIQIKDRDVVEARTNTERAMFESMKRTEQAPVAK